VAYHVLCGLVDVFRHALNAFLTHSSTVSALQMGCPARVIHVFRVWSQRKIVPYTRLPQKEGKHAATPRLACWKGETLDINRVCRMLGSIQYCVDIVHALVRARHRPQQPLTLPRLHSAA